MPRLVTPHSNPHVHGSHTLTPYTVRRRSPSETGTSDKENASPSQENTTSKMPLASQAAFREKLQEKTDTQYYNPFQNREYVRKISAKYRRLQQEATGA